MSGSGIAKVSATPAGVGMVGPADRWLLAGARNHRLPYATPSGSIPPDTHLRGASLRSRCASQDLLYLRRQRERVERFGDHALHAQLEVAALIGRLHFGG